MGGVHGTLLAGFPRALRAMFFFWGATCSKTWPLAMKAPGLLGNVPPPSCASTALSKHMSPCYRRFDGIF